MARNGVLRAPGLSYVPLAAGSLTPAGGVSVHGNAGGTDQSPTLLKSTWPLEKSEPLKSTVPPQNPARWKWIVPPENRTSLKSTVPPQNSALVKSTAAPENRTWVK
jgi:hypothetical protein